MKHPGKNSVLCCAGFLTLMFGTVQTAPIAYADHVVCAASSYTEVCFYHSGDRVSVWDKRNDGRASFGDIDSFEIGHLYNCVNNSGYNTTIWCRWDLVESHTIRITACHYLPEVNCPRILGRNPKSARAGG